MKKYNHEKILYFASQGGGFNTNKHSPSDLKKMVNDLVSQKLLTPEKFEDGFTVYSTTPSGKKRLLEYQAAYQKKKQAALQETLKQENTPAVNEKPLTESNEIVSFDEKLAQFHHIASELSDEGVVCLDTSILANRALLDAKLFETLGIDDAGTYIKIKSDFSPSLLNYLATGAADDALTTALTHSKEDVLYLNSPTTLSEYRDVAYRYLQDMVDRGRLTQVAVNGINELHFDVCFDEGRDLNVVLHELMENSSRHEFNSPEHLEQLNNTLFDSAKKHLSKFSEQDPYHTEQFCVTAKRITGRDFSQANADHLFKEVKRHNMVELLLDAAQSIKQAHPDLEPKILLEALKEKSQEALHYAPSIHALSLALSGELTPDSLNPPLLSAVQKEPGNEGLMQKTANALQSNENSIKLKMR